MAQHSSLIFITGGVRSGKSRFAEDLAEKIWRRQEDSKLHYIASMQKSDEEMASRIARHQEDRRKSGLPWQTWEQPVGIGELVPFFHKHDVVLLDCLTTWLNNALFFSSNGWQNIEFVEKLFTDMCQEMTAISRQVRALIIVSNEVLHEPLDTNELIITYSRLLGTLHQWIVKNAREAYVVEMGIPVPMKGAKVCGE